MTRNYQVTVLVPKVDYVKKYHSNNFELIVIISDELMASVIRKLDFINSVTFSMGPVGLDWFVRSNTLGFSKGKLCPG